MSGAGDGGDGHNGAAAVGVLESVTVFVTRGMGMAQELLVLAGADSGGAGAGTAHLPGGLVEAGETPAAAARRILRDQAGLTAPAVLADLGAHPEPLEPYQRVLLRDARLRQGPDPAAPHLEHHTRVDPRLRRGACVRQTGAQAGFVQVVYEVTDHAESGSEVVRFIEGWLEADAVTPSAERRHFHAPVGDAAPASRPAERRWTPLSGETGLMPADALRLAEFLDRLQRD